MHIAARLRVASPSVYTTDKLEQSYKHTHPRLLHTHECTPTPLPPLTPPPFVFPAILSFQTRRQDDFFFPLNKNNLLSDVRSLIVVTGPKLKCGLIKAAVCVSVCVCAWV